MQGLLKQEKIHVVQGSRQAVSPPTPSRRVDAAALNGRPRNYPDPALSTPLAGSRVDGFQRGDDRERPQAGPGCAESAIVLGRAA